MQTRFATLLLSFVAMVASATPSAASGPSMIRGVAERADILSRASTKAEVNATVPAGTTLEVLDTEADWYWVLTAPDVHGTRRPGWIRAQDVDNPPDSLAARLVAEEAAKAAAKAEKKEQKAKAKQEKLEKQQAKKQEQQEAAEAKADIERPNKALAKAQKRLEAAQAEYEKTKGVAAAPATTATPPKQQQ